MRVLRGRDPRPAVDREHTAALLADASDGTPGVRVWTPPRQVAFGRRDAREPGFGRAKRLAAERGFEPIERDVGASRRVPGRHARVRTRAPARRRPGFRVDSGPIRARDRDGYQSVAEPRRGGVDRRAAGVVLSGRSLNPRRGWRQSCGDRPARSGDAALVAGCLVVTRADASAVADATAAVYDALGVPFDPETVGSVAEANGPEDPKPVARALEDAFVDGPWGDGEPKIDRIDRSG